MRTLLFMVLLLIGATACDTNYGIMTDERDGQRYKTVKIGDQVWMAENLNYKMDDSWCFDDDPAHCKTYGRLYTWEAAKRGCPAGWHLPTDDEWEQLEDYLGVDAGHKMKSTAGWDDDGNGDNSSGFSGLPGGLRDLNGNFGYLGFCGTWWSATESGANDAWYRRLYYYGANATRYYYYKQSGFSVRCARD